MIKRQPFIVLAIAGSMMASGCALLLVGAGAAGGYAISKDSVKNVFDFDKGRAFDQSLAVVKEMGAVKSYDPGHSVIKAEVQDVNITVSIKQLTSRTIEIKVTGRNHIFMPKVDVAQEVYNKIAERLSP